ncbi:hypothetical protein ANN_21849 [Periplaneta americana]|uniref:LRRCT domain-containing protein n=1 Tax=Periplaneta americana TaxID=6978 RepID=A0ABQ8S6S4_PERAM|nr:hypothetical protein ANN_21849 [Periplaneta americana]
MSPRSNTESYLAFAHIGLRENPGKNLNQITCPDRESNPGHLVSRLDVLTVTPQVWTGSFIQLGLRVVILRDETDCNEIRYITQTLVHNSTTEPPGWKTSTTADLYRVVLLQTVELGAGSLPAATLELNVSGAGELRLLAGAFSQVAALQRVRVDGVGRVVVRRHAFLNLSAPHTLLEVLDCGRAVLERHAFRAVRGPLTASVARCAHVVVQGAAFSWILAITLRDVPRLELSPQAFAFEAPTTVGRHGPAATDYDEHQLLLVQVLLQNVVLAELPRDTFPSSAAEVRLVDAEVRTVQSGAFCANTLFAVIFQNTSLHRVETGAFSDRTLIKYLELSGVRIRVMAARALQAAVDNLTVQHSRYRTSPQSHCSAFQVPYIITTTSLFSIPGTVHHHHNLTVQHSRYRTSSPQSHCSAFQVPYITTISLFSIPGTVHHHHNLTVQHSRYRTSSPQSHCSAFQVPYIITTISLFSIPGTVHHHHNLTVQHSRYRTSSPQPHCSAFQVPYIITTTSLFSIPGTVHHHNLTVQHSRYRTSSSQPHCSAFQVPYITTTISLFSIPGTVHHHHNLTLQYSRYRTSSPQSLRRGVIKTFSISGEVHYKLSFRRVSEVSEGAVNITVAKASFLFNAFEKIEARGLVLKSWNMVRMDNNTFGFLAADAIRLPFEALPGVSSHEFSFAGNELDRLSPGALRFAVEALEGGAGIKARLVDNRFSQLCHCNLLAWVRDVTAGRRGVEEVFNSSACTVDAVLARCFNVPEGYLNMRDYTEQVCGTADVIVCEETKGESAVSVVRDADDDVDRDRKVLGLIFLVVVCAMVVILVITGVLWLRRNGYCVRARLLLLPTTTSCLTMFSTLFQGAGGLVPARSISRLSMHEYTELQQQQLQKQRQGLLVAAEDNASDGEVEEVPCEDKWTQTLPEELTQELLQSLREKLDDPENYSEARDMIEHLYDLIKVEESCNNNNMPSTSRPVEELLDDEDDDLYDVIQVPARLRHSRAKRATMCSVGTRAPSPDKLLPYSQARRNRAQAVVCDYVEPRDREQHVYTELPGGAPPPATEPASADPPANKSPSRPLSFLRALGESILPARKTPQLCDYTEPTDAAVHVYTEVPAASTLRCSSKMANRPLPTKPDQEEDDPGEGTSASSH